MPFTRKVTKDVRAEMKRLAAEGKTRLEIAKLLKVSLSTVRTYIGSDQPREH
ncbi:helix-turn-helix domain-containing protein [Leptolyngbya sp. AN02str]|uniref:helix-turn-helix domain-containing protein n=1 Tax=Leptolyngbya sp. AN02str TaxID=3423363 RepID=UPI003D31466D